jgi:hypothetical protein
MARRRMTIALDYDDTWTEDPGMWAQFVDLARAQGHDVIVITARQRSPENEKELLSVLPCGTDFHFSFDEPKGEYAKRKGIAVDVWIDDSPGWIVGVT